MIPSQPPCTHAADASLSSFNIYIVDENSNLWRKNSDDTYENLLISAQKVAVHPVGNVFGIIDPDGFVYASLDGETLN